MKYYQLCNLYFVSTLKCTFCLNAFSDLLQSLLAKCVLTVRASCVLNGLRLNADSSFFSFWEGSFFLMLI